MWTMTHLLACIETTLPDTAATTTVSVGLSWVSDPALEPGAPEAPLSRRFLGRTNVPTQLTVHIDDGGVPIELTTLTPSIDHDFPIIGLQPGVPTTVVVTPGSGGALGPAVTFDIVADPLPVAWPSIEVDVRNEARVAPGWTLVGFSRSGAEAEAAQYAALLDSFGGVRWLRTAPTDVLDLDPYPPARVSGLRLGEAFVWNLLGETEVAFTHTGNTTSTGIGVTPFAVHHDLVREPSGTWLTLALGQLLVPNYPTSYESAAERQSAVIADERVLRLDDQGAVLADWSLAERLDPARIGYNALLDRFGVGLDWGHANSVAYDAEHHEVVVSLRHQDAVVGLDADSGDLRWILATPDNWNDALAPLRLVGELDWFFHQHAPEPVEGGLLLFDNGNEGTSPFSDAPRIADADNRSRVVRYAIDREAGTVAEAWAFDAPLPGRMYSNREGDANALPNGNVLSVWGSVDAIDGVSTEELGLATDVVFLIEVTEDLETVWQLRLGADPTDWPAGWSANRAVRVDNPWEGLAELLGPLP
jgi:hypothetical protein